MEGYGRRLSNGKGAPKLDSPAPDIKKGGPKKASVK